jgi:hypothetical protein
MTGCRGVEEPRGNPVPANVQGIFLSTLRMPSSIDGNDGSLCVELDVDTFNEIDIVEAPTTHPLFA